MRLSYFAVDRLDLVKLGVDKSVVIGLIKMKRDKIERILKFICNEFIYGGHLLSLGAAGIVFTSAILLNISPRLDGLVVAYLITYSVYSYNRLKEFKKDFSTNSKRTQHIERYIEILPFIIFCSELLAFLLLFYFSNFRSLIFSLLMLIGGLSYTLYFKKITKQILAFKSIYVAFFWAFLVIFTMLYYNTYVNVLVFFLFSFVLLRWLINTIFFDIKDIDSDQLEGLKTIPVVLGKDKTLRLLHFFNFLSFIPILAGIYMNILPPALLFFLIFFFYSFYYLVKIKNPKTDIHSLSYIVVDGEYMFWPLILMLGIFVFNI